jgi:hypothetical protein
LHPSSLPHSLTQKYLGIAPTLTSRFNAKHEDNTKQQTTATQSIFQRLNERGAILDVAMDRVEILRPQDSQYAIGARDLNRCSCLVLMGTGPMSAIIMACINRFSSRDHTSEDGPGSDTRIHTTSSDDVHYMSLLRGAIGMLIKEPELFQLPLTWVIFGQYEGDIQLENLKEKTSKVFKHLSVKLEMSLYEAYHPGATQSSTDRSTVVAVRHEAEAPEIYVEDRLVHPKVHSGSLALLLDKLGLKQIGYEYGDDDVNDDDQEKSWKKISHTRSRGVAFLERQPKTKMVINTHVGSGHERS